MKVSCPHLMHHAAGKFQGECCVCTWLRGREEKLTLGFHFSFRQAEAPSLETKSNAEGGGEGILLLGVPALLCPQWLCQEHD